MTERDRIERIELAVRRTSERVRKLPAYNLDVIQALDMLADELAQVGRTVGERADTTEVGNGR